MEEILIYETGFKNCPASISSHTFLLSGWIGFYKDCKSPLIEDLLEKWVVVKLKGYTTREEFNSLFSDLSQAHKFEILIGPNKIEFDGFFEWAGLNDGIEFDAQIKSFGQIILTDIESELVDDGKTFTIEWEEV